MPTFNCLIVVSKLYTLCKSFLHNIHYYSHSAEGCSKMYCKPCRPFIFYTNYNNKLRNSLGIAYKQIATQQPYAWL